jgi:hypothetical protein
VDIRVNPGLVSDSMSIDVNVTSPVDKTRDLIQDESLGKQRKLVNDEGDSHCVEVSGCSACAPADFSLGCEGGGESEGRGSKCQERQEKRLQSARPLMVVDSRPLADRVGQSPDALAYQLRVPVMLCRREGARSSGSQHPFELAQDPIRDRPAKEEAKRRKLLVTIHSPDRQIGSETLPSRLEGTGSVIVPSGKESHSIFTNHGLTLGGQFAHEVQQQQRVFTPGFQPKSKTICSPVPPEGSLDFGDIDSTVTGSQFDLRHHVFKQIVLGAKPANGSQLLGIKQRTANVQGSLARKPTQEELVQRQRAHAVDGLT